MPKMNIEERVELQDVSLKLCDEFELFEPCGMGNPRPVLAVFGVSVPSRPMLFGKEENHLSFHARQNKTARRVVAFNGAQHFNALSDLSKGGSLDVVFRPEKNTFRGETHVELYMEAFRVSG